MTGLALLGFALPADAATRYVCSSACSYLTIASAYSAASDGDTISIDAGTWTEDLDVKKALIIEGAGPTTIISGLIEISSVTSSVTLKNLKINGASTRRCVYVKS